ncbi:hypothetical protein G9U51_09110 [Calidifontibacter sp. DB0510]|uniref:DUF559 domain-containing protein n=1 Tax=Metallococcus carri TaxID=1656884 RepID=A0A967B5E1_9MICO|nr:hypothetical protein [Metallococcus carri]NHN55932.1 hypothetical protein [Metallococcus carri]NOP38380.1 hypothetical protein [Calidifontibacter sp. DB2511S]
MRHLDLRHPFTIADAEAAGLSRHRLTSKAFRPLYAGCFVDASVEITREVWLDAALAISPPDAFLVLETAARQWGATVPDTSTIHLGTFTSRRLRRPGLVLHRYSKPIPLLRRNNRRLTTPAQTFAMNAAKLDLVDAVVLGDSLVRLGLIEVPELQQRCGPSRNARRAARLVSDRVDSAMETRARLLLVLAGLPEPIVNLEVTDARGRPRRLDLAYPEWKVAIEYDGRHHIQREEQWQADLARREDLEGIGWRFVVVVAPDIYATPDRTIRRVSDAVAAAGGPAYPISPEWKRHFPVRA